MILSFVFSAIIAYLIAYKWPTKKAAFVGGLAACLIGWFLGAIAITALTTGSPSDAALVGFTQGIWFALTGAVVGSIVGIKHSSQS